MLLQGRCFRLSLETVHPARMEIKMSPIPSLTMNDGHSIPQLGFGIWNVPKEDTADVVASALKVGYRLIDGAYTYGNEAGLGAGVRQSGLSRDSVFITTKVWNSDQGKDKTRMSVERSLKAIGVDQLDLVLIHWPAPKQDLYFETWKALIGLREEGLIRSIGVSNFNADHLDRLIAETDVVPVVNQIEVNPRLQQAALCAANEARSIISQAWTPLGNGASFDEDPIRTIAERVGKSPAQVILRWHLQSGRVVIPRSSNAQRQAQNVDLFDFELTDAEMQEFKALEAGMRTGPDPLRFE